MANSSVWSGYLTFGLISIPVRLFSGARSTHVSFHMLHRKDGKRVKQQLVCSADEKVVERSEIVKGYEYRKGEYVIVEPEEIKKIEPRTAKAMEILEFVKRGEIDPVYFEASYYLMPAEEGKRPYALLMKTLEDSGYVGIAKLTMHNREYTAFLRPHAGGIMLHTMFYQDEIRKVEGYGDIDTKPKPAEVKMAQQLIEALAGKWKPEKYHDVFEQNVKTLIKAKLEGHAVTAPEPTEKQPKTDDLLDALKQSLAGMEGRRKQPQRVEAAQRANHVSISEGRAKKPKRAARKAA